ncbi:MAG: glycosyltransferase [Prevotella sp.]|nr:glycosyltransferase [Prevotella sp.]MCI2080543.1 glycosyltransferase [Prevotella sp.]MCI2102370.1 glycosyltransferase [Prevotella sp.]
MKHNILFLMGVYPSYGGVEKVSTILANAFVECGHSVSIVSFDQPHPEVAKAELNHKIELYKLEYPVSNKENLRKLREILVKRQIDILINQWAVPYYVARLCHKATQGLNCKVITVHHNDPSTNARIKGVEIDIARNVGVKALQYVRLFLVRIASRLSLRYTYNKCDRFVVLSPSFIPIASKFMGLHHPHKILALPNPITIEPCSDIDSTIRNKRKEIIWVGRIEYNQKRTFRLIDIWQRLYLKHPDWHLTIVGDGPDRQDLQKRIIDAKLQNVEITGFKNPIEYYKRASILLLVSEYEGFPLVNTESMSYGVVPVVLGSFAACYDIIDNEKNGVIVPMPFSASQFANVVDRLISNESMLKKIAGAAYIKSEIFSKRRIVEKWNQLMDEVACSK